MDTSISQIEQQVSDIFLQVIKKTNLESGSILVLGASSSEIAGHHIGHMPSNEIGTAVIQTAIKITRAYNIYLAVQGCEHINRSLAICGQATKEYNLEIVNVVPSLKAGGACCSIAYSNLKNAVMVENIKAHAGIDIGDTNVGMHVKFVQVPFRQDMKKVGNAHVTCLYSRPKLIGGERALYA